MRSGTRYWIRFSPVHVGSDNKYGMSMFSSWPFKLGSETLRDRGGERRRDDYSKGCTRGGDRCDGNAAVVRCETLGCSTWRSASGLHPLRHRGKKVGEGVSTLLPRPPCPTFNALNLLLLSLPSGPLTLSLPFIPVGAPVVILSQPAK